MRGLSIALIMIAGLLGPGPGPALAADSPKSVAIFAGGCFWCVESDFDSIPGVLETVSGFTGGTTPNPTYMQVVRKGTGHREALHIVFDPEQVTYKQLLVSFWRSIDPTDAGGQFCDRGEPYTTAVFVLDSEQRQLAEERAAAVGGRDESGRGKGPRPENCDNHRRRR